MSPATTERRWSIEDVAIYLDVPIETLYAWRKKGYGPRAARIGKHLRYDPNIVRAWFAEQLSK